MTLIPNVTAVSVNGDNVLVNGLGVMDNAPLAREAASV
jgi:hypothetical protein